MAIFCLIIFICVILFFIIGFLSDLKSEKINPNDPLSSTYIKGFESKKGKAERINLQSRTEAKKFLEDIEPTDYKK